MSTLESDQQMEYVIGEVYNRLNEILRTSLMIIFAALAVLLFSVLYLLKPLYQFRRTSAPVTRVRSCPCVETLSNKESYPVAPSILKDNDLDVKTRKTKANDIKFNSNIIIEKEAEKITTSKDSCQGPNEYHIDEDFIREIGLPECFKLPHLNEI